MRVLAESHVDEDGGDLDLLERGARVECTASRRADEGKEDEDGGLTVRELSSSAAIESDGQTLIRIASHVPFQHCCRERAHRLSHPVLDILNVLYLRDLRLLP